jgi:ATP-dependent DNA helicase RecQ
MLRPREPEPGDEGLFQAIASWRYDRAKVDGVASYRIFGNQVLAAITTAKPVDRYELLQIHGLGEQKVDLYGNDIIAIVRDHIDGEW